MGEVRPMVSRRELARVLGFVTFTSSAREKSRLLCAATCAPRAATFEDTQEAGANCRHHASRTMKVPPPRMLARREAVEEGRSGAGAHRCQHRSATGATSSSRWPRGIASTPLGAEDGANRVLARQAVAASRRRREAAAPLRRRRTAACARPRSSALEERARCRRHTPRASAIFGKRDDGPRSVDSPRADAGGDRSGGAAPAPPMESQHQARIHRSAYGGTAAGRPSRPALNARARVFVALKCRLAPTASNKPRVAYALAVNSSTLGQNSRRAAARAPSTRARRRALRSAAALQRRVELLSGRCEARG